jgi:hypothetical protein
MKSDLRDTVGENKKGCVLLDNYCEIREFGRVSVIVLSDV